MEKDEAKPGAFPWAANSPGPPEQNEGTPSLLITYLLL